METVKFWVVLLVHKILKRLPDGFILEATVLVGPMVKRLMPKIRQQFDENHAVAFSDMSQDGLRQVSHKALVRHMQSSIMDLKYGLCDSSQVGVGFEFADLEKLSRVYKDSAVICVVPHLGMSLLAAKLLAKHGNKRVVVTVRGLKKSSGFERLYIKRMSDSRLEFIKVGNAMERVAKAIEDKAIIVLGFDTIEGVKYSHKVKFFDREVALPSGPVWLASKYNLPVMAAAAVVEQRPFRIVIETHPALQGVKNSPQQLQVLASSLEEQIKANPGSWCAHDKYFA